MSPRHFLYGLAHFIPIGAAAVVLGACSSSDAGSTAQGGASYGGSAGGLLASGGSTAQGSVAGGAVGLGGAQTAGGVGSASATTLQGGTTSQTTTVASAGSSVSAGGATSSGGTAAKGGTSSSGGTTAKGGATSSGGNTAKGGTSSSGGTTAKGGTTSSGGNTAKGGTSSSGGTTSTTTHTGAWKITALGDSITGTTCYPQLLAQTLINGSHSNFTMVGSNLNNQSCNGAPTRQTEGHGGYLVTYLLTDSPAVTGRGTLTELNNWTNTATDVLLIHFGTNDVWSNIAPASILSAYEFVIGKYRAKNPNLIVFVSKIVSMNPSGCADCATRVTNLDAQITPSWATAQSTSTSPVYIIDHSTAISPATDTADGVHPNVTGAQKMATVTYNALIAGQLPGL